MRKRQPYVPINPLASLAVIAGLFVVAYLLTPVIVAMAVSAVIYVGVKVFKKIRHARRRAEGFPAKLSGGEVHITATPPGLNQGPLQGRLQGIRDAKQVKKLIDAAPVEVVTFTVPAKADVRWVGGYRTGIAEILPSATVQQNYAPQQGSTIV
jgi:hypothetical protein